MLSKQTQQKRKTEQKQALERETEPPATPHCGRRRERSDGGKRERSSEVRATFHQSSESGELQRYCGITCPKPHTSMNIYTNIHGYHCNLLKAVTLLPKLHFTVALH